MLDGKTVTLNVLLLYFFTILRECQLFFQEPTRPRMLGFFWRTTEKRTTQAEDPPPKAAEMTFSITVRGCSVSPGRGIMSTILTLNYSNSCCSCCLRTTLRIKHEDQAGIRRKPLTSAEPPLCGGGAHAHTAPPKAHTKLPPALQRATRTPHCHLV